MVEPMSGARSNEAITTEVAERSSSMRMTRKGGTRPELAVVASDHARPYLEGSEPPSGGPPEVFPCDTEQSKC